MYAKVLEWSSRTQRALHCMVERGEWEGPMLTDDSRVITARVTDTSPG